MRTTQKKAHQHKKRSFVLALLVTALIVGLPIFLITIQQRQNTKQFAATNNPDLDTIVKDTITSINQYGWDPTNKWYHINWYIPTPTQYQNPGHDSQNDLRMYEAMVWYEYRHPGDTTFKAQIAALLPTVQSEWGNTTLAKGWVYFLLLRLAKYSGDSTYWTNTAKNWATKAYQDLTSTGAVVVPHGSVADSTATNAPVCVDGYRVDQNIENGLALVEAGKRFNNTAWAQAGAQEVTIIQQQAYNTQNHLFYRIVCQGQPWDPVARNGEMGQITEAFIDSGLATNNQSYIIMAQQSLDAINNPATGYIDSVNGGLWFDKNLLTGGVNTSKKVTQQFHILIALHKADKIMNNKYISLEQNMTQMLGSKSWAPPPVAGWLYERNPDWSFYKGTENWISTEASGIAMEAAQLLLEDQSPQPSSGAGLSPTVSTAMTPTPTIPTPTYVCAGSSKGICPTPSTAPTVAISSTITPTDAPTSPQISTITTDTPEPSVSIVNPTIAPPSSNNSKKNFLLVILLFLLTLFETLFRHMKF